MYFHKKQDNGQQMQEITRSLGFVGLELTITISNLYVKYSKVLIISGILSKGKVWPLQGKT